ncbi:MAG: MBL fold metallo-hydrolase [Cetobacterium sp.]
MENFKSYYIYHSCFVVETEKYFLVFDYYKDPIKSEKDDISLKDAVLNTSKKVCVFSSHAHYDHFNSEILNWKNRYSEINYILSGDIILDKKLQNYNIMNKDEVLNLEELNIKSYDSSDAGVSFLVLVDKIQIFHAGDLNWWYWKDDTPAEEKYMKNLYTGIVSKIMKNKEIDIAFFPVDPRLEEFCYSGVEYFIENVKPKIIVPMHFDDNFYVTKELKNRLNKTEITIIEIKTSNSLLN